MSETGLLFNMFIISPHEGTSTIELCAVATMFSNIIFDCQYSVNLRCTFRQIAHAQIFEATTT